MKWNSKYTLVMTIVLLAGLSFGVFKSFRNPGISVRVCLPKSPASSLALVADKHGFFRDEGLAVTTNISDLGKDCVENLLQSKVDLAVSNVPPVVSAIEQGNPLIVLTELSSSTQNTAMVILKQNGKSIEVEKDLIGQKIGIVENTNSETFLRLYFKAHDMDPTSMQFIGLKSLAELGKSLKIGDIKAAVMWEPFLTKFVESLPKDSWLTQHSVFYTQFCVLASTSQFAAAHTEALEKFTRALAKAQEFNKHHREEVRQLTISELKFLPQDLQPSVWNKFRFEVGLSSVLVTMMQQSQKPLIDLPDAIENQRATLVFRSLHPQVLRKITKDLVTYE